MANTIIKLTARDETKQGLQSATSSFQQFKSSIDSLTGGLASKLTNLLANPWTAVAGAVAGAVKITKELWDTGVEATAGFEQLRASFGDYAMEVDGMLDAIDRTTLATKDDLEGMAKALSQYGMSMEDLESTLQTTADIATVTGKSFGTVESAVISALNGQDRALQKLVPEWETMKETYGSAETALRHLGEQYSSTRAKFTDGSITQTLDNMSSSWQNIKDNLGQTLVMKIQSSGVLDTISTTLSNIERKVSDRFTRESFEETYGVSKDMDISKFHSDIVSGVIPESEARAYREVLKSTILPWNWQIEMRETLKDALSEVSSNEISDTDVEFAELISSFRNLRHLTTWEEDRGELLHSIDELIDKYIYYDADETRIENIRKFRGEVEGYQRYSSTLPSGGFLDMSSGRSTFIDSEGTVWQIGESGQWEITPPTTLSPEEASFLKETTTTAEILTKCAYGKFSEVTEDDWNHVFSTIALSDELWDAYADKAFEYYDAWNLSKSSKPSPSSPYVSNLPTGTFIDPNTGRLTYTDSEGTTYQMGDSGQWEIPMEQTDPTTKEYQTKVIDVVSGILTNTESFVANTQEAIESFRSGEWWKAIAPSLQATGNIFDSLSSAGSALAERGTDNWFTGLASTLGTISPWLSVGAGAVSLITSLINKDDEESSTEDEVSKAQNITYSGATTVNISNSFEGATIVGSDGMKEFAKILRRQFEELDYYNE